eukprot:TRINITY_DN29860_c0_g1_i1.p1 TRINITY_DN29860_c0_g1~~TRINITY_DN29860_c0_g1_i1.p1  ORF type:complete len:112 (-),score=49.31 TRINITY_DN29860_c0_g1_i1:3-338(-)
MCIRDRKTVAQQFIPAAAGAMAGGTEICITMPLDTVKTYMQINKGLPNMAAAGRDIFAQKGMAGFYFGLPAMMLQVSCKAGIRFLAFEQLKLAIAVPVSYTHLTLPTIYSV